VQAGSTGLWQNFCSDIGKFLMDMSQIQYVQSVNEWSLLLSIALTAFFYFKHRQLEESEESDQLIEQLLKDQ
jgi:hypothetical protein